MTDGEKPTVRPQDAAASLDGRQPARTTDKRHHKGAYGKLASQKKASRAAAVQRIATALGVDFFSGDALTLLQCVYKDPRQPGEVRIMAADKALRYERPSLAAVQHSGNIGNVSHEEALELLRQGRPAAAVPATTH